MGEVLVFDVLFQGLHFHRLTLVHAEVALRNGDVPEAVGHVDLHAAGNVLRTAGTDFVCVVTRARSYSSGFRLAIAEKERHRIVRMAGLRPVWNFNLAA